MALPDERFHTALSLTARVDRFHPPRPERAMRSIVRQANALGFTVHFDPIQAA